MLVVLDGWGYRAEREGNAIALAQTPTWDALVSRYPQRCSEASGLAVGLPEGQMGNSEVGHLNLGAGRVVMQDLVRIGESIADSSVLPQPRCSWTRARRAQAAQAGRVHLVGLIGKGGVHAIDKHLFALIDLCAEERVPRIAIHALLDGRDTMPRSGLGYMRELLEHAAGKAVVASVGGRYYGMDRDKRWDRIEKWYQRGGRRRRSARATDPLEVIRSVIRAERHRRVHRSRRSSCEDGKAGGADARWRRRHLLQLSRGSDASDRAALTDAGLRRIRCLGPAELDVVTMTSLRSDASTSPVGFPPQSMKNIVAEVVSNAGMTHVPRRRRPRSTRT